MWSSCDLGIANVSVNLIFIVTAFLVLIHDTYYIATIFLYCLASPVTETGWGQLRFYQNFSECMLTAQNGVIYSIWKQNIVLLFLATRKSSSCNPAWYSKEIMTQTALFHLAIETPDHWSYLQCLYYWQTFRADLTGRFPEFLEFVIELP